MKALVTGAAGFIASHLAGLLLDHGAEVIGLDSFTDYYARSLKEANLATLRGRSGFRFVEARIQDADLPTLLDGVTHVFHLAAQAGVRKSWGRDFTHYTVNNVEATQVLLEACVDRPVERLVYASTSSAYGDFAPIPMREDTRPQPLSPYGVTKLAAEHLCQLYFANYGVPAVALRYFTVYGPRQRPDMGFHRFLTAAHRGEPITVYGDGEQTRDFTFVADAVEATRLAGVRGVPGRVYNIGGGSRVSVNDVLRIVERVVGRPLVLRREPPQKGDMRDTYADTSLAQTDLGFRPAATLDAGIAAEYAWLRPQLDALFPSHDMTMIDPIRRAFALTVALALLACAGACAASRNKVPAGTSEPDKFLFDRGNEALANKKWMSAREFYQTLIDTYPQSPHRADAKLGLADSYLGDGSLASQVLALNEYREFLSFYPTHARADYAQFKTAMAHYYQMAKPGRDQTETRQAITEFQTFFERYPNSSLVGDARTHYREARDRKGQSDFGIGLTYFRIKWYPGAVSRFEELLKGDPEFTFRDGAYFYLAESLVKLNRQAEALPLLEKLVAEFQQSEFLENAQKRISELKTALAAAAAPKAS